MASKKSELEHNPRLFELIQGCYEKCPIQTQTKKEHTEICCESQQYCCFTCLDTTCPIKETYRTEIRDYFQSGIGVLRINYKTNPKTEGSAILGAIPQTGLCPNRCEDCYFQSGRSFLEPLEKNLPNLPPIALAQTHVVRVNDGNDSNYQPELVISMTNCYPQRFFNTCVPTVLDKFPDPVVLTINPGKMTDTKCYKLDPIPKNLMFVRVRTNTWNLGLVREAIAYYTERKVPVVLTFMAYYNQTSIPESHVSNYISRKRTINNYYAITTDAWKKIMLEFMENPFVYSCGKVEGERGTTKCMRCGNCVREYYNTKEQMNKESSK